MNKPRKFLNWIEVPTYKEAEDGGYYNGIPLKMAVLFERVASTEEEAPLMKCEGCYWVKRYTE